MRKAFPTFLLLYVMMLATPALAQDTAHVYQSVFGDSSTVWYIDAGDEGGGTTGVWQIHSADTGILNGTTYQIIRPSDEFFFDEYGWDYGDVQYPHYVRESPDHSKLYLRSHVGLPGVNYVYDSAPDPVHEILLMDLDLDVGDTFDTRSWAALTWNLIWDGPMPEPIIVDSVYYQDGRKVVATNYYHAMWATAGEDDRLLFTEGVGPSMGLLYPRRLFAHMLMCYERDGSTVFQRIEGDCVHTWFTGIPGDLPRNEEIQVYPNPATDAVNVGLPVDHAYSLRLMSVTGKVLYSTVGASGLSVINLDSYPSGVYLVVATSGSQAFTFKIVKK